MLTSLALAALAGIVSILSPCVLPLVPIVLGTASAEHKYGPVALAAGLALSFTVTGLFLATIGFSIGLDSGLFRTVAAFLMIVIGVTMIFEATQKWFAAIAAPVTDAAEQRFSSSWTSGLWGQFAVGGLLGVVWSPCVGPTLGAAALLAAHGKDLGSVAATMLAFGLGAALPMLLLGTLSRAMLLRWRQRMMASGVGMKRVMGIIMISIGVLIITGLDKTLEAKLVDISPEWLITLTTRF